MGHLLVVLEETQMVMDNIQSIYNEAERKVVSVLDTPSTVQ
jgi:hypothetical protein